MRVKYLLLFPFLFPARILLFFSIEKDEGKKFIKYIYICILFQTQTRSFGIRVVINLHGEKSDPTNARWFNRFSK